MKKKTFAFISGLIAVSVCIQMFCGLAVYADDNNSIKSTESPLWYMKELSGSQSSWDKALAWNGSNYSSAFGQVKNVELTDGSNWLKSEAYREINEIKSGIVTLDFDFTLDKYVDDVGFRLLDGTNTVFGIVTKGADLYLEQPDGEQAFLSNYSISMVEQDMVTFVQAHLGFDNKRIIDVYINGKKCIEDKPFVTPADKANGFDIETDEKSSVLILNQRVNIYSGYIIYEDFFGIKKSMPIGWEFEENGGNISVYTVNNRNADRHSMQMNTEKGEIKTVKRFDPASGHVVFEICTLQPKKRNGISVNVSSGDSAALSLTADGSSFCYSDGNNNVPFYTYTDNVWYILKLDMDLDNSTADIYLNNKLMAENVKLKEDISSIDNISVSADKNENEFIIDDVKLYHGKEYPKDYVPAPQKPNRDDNFVIGMQMCPLWTEGAYNKAWDYIKSAPDRMPILGAYDEGNPEVNDWFNKWMVDHGYDFQWICAYPNYPMNFNGYQPPIKPNMVREGNAIYEGYMNSRYSEQLKFAVVIENSFMNKGSVHKDSFFNNILPYYIEYYFKDDRYLKIDGRPVVSVYVMDNFLNMFEGMNGLTGAAAAKAGVDKFKQMCIDAGVGEPYLLSQIGESSYIAKDYAYYSQCGIDGINTYGYGQLTPLGKQKTILQKAEDLSNQYKIDTIPCLQPRIGHEAWELRTGWNATQEEFEEALGWVKSEFGNGSHSKLSKQLFMTATWDEYGEGHIMCPNEGDGFMYIDAVRNVFTGNNVHDEIIPTEAQKERVNRLVVQDRKPDKVRENRTPEIPQAVKMGWYFTNTEDLGMWAAESNIGDITQTGEGLSVTASGKSPTISIKQKISFDISDITYIKIRMKRNSTSAGGVAHWTTSTDGEYNENKRRYFSPTTTDADKFKDYYIPVGKNIHWKGLLTGLKINLGIISDYSEPFVVESIELMQDEALNKKAKVSFDGALYVCNPEPVIKNGTVMLPLKELCGAYGGAVSNYTIDNSFLINYGSNQTIVKLGSDTAIKNNAAIGVGEPAYAVSDIVNDTVFVPLNLLSDALDKKISYDAETKTVEIESAKKTSQTVERKILKSFDCDNDDTVSNVSGITSLTYSDGKMIAKTGGYPIFITSAFDGVNMKDVKVIAIKITSTVASTLKVLYNSYEDAAITADKASRAFNLYAGENIIEIPTSELYKWEGTMKWLRVQPVYKEATVEIDWIRVLGDPLPSKKSEEDISSCVSKTDDKYSWEFDKNTSFDGWSLDKSLGNTSISNGELRAKIVGKNPKMTTCGTLSLNSEDITSIDISLTNMTAGKKARLYFQTDENGTWKEENSFEIDISDHDLFAKTYSIKTTDNANWTGKINKLMLVPTEYRGSVSIDYIRLNLLQKTE